MLINVNTFYYADCICIIVSSDNQNMMLIDSRMLQEVRVKKATPALSAILILFIRGLGGTLYPCPIKTMCIMNPINNYLHAQITL